VVRSPSPPKTAAQRPDAPRHAQPGSPPGARTGDPASPADPGLSAAPTGSADPGPLSARARGQAGARHELAPTGVGGAGIGPSEVGTAGIGASAATAPVSSLAGELRSRDESGLVALLRFRPDLVHPVPTDLAHLSMRATTRASVARAVDRLDRWTLQVLETVLGLTTPTSTDAVRRTLTARAPGTPADQPDVDPAVVDSAVAHLRELALIWGAEDDIQVVRAVPEVLGPFPAGLAGSVRALLPAYPPARVAGLAEALGLTTSGDPVADAAAIAGQLGDATRCAGLVGAAVQAAGPGVTAVLDRLTWGPPAGRVDDADRAVTLEAATTPVDALLARGLLVATDPRTVTLPLEVALHLRGGAAFRHPAPLPPRADVAPVPNPGTAAPGSAPADSGAHPDSAPADSGSRAESAAPAAARATRVKAPTAAARRKALADRAARVDSLGTGTALEVLRLVDALAVSWEAHPPALLRSGGVGTRDIKRLAATLAVPETTAVLLIEVAGAAGLVNADDDGWLPTAAYDLWGRADPAARWENLARAWLDMSRAPGMVGQHDSRDKVVAPLGAEAESSLAAEVRRGVLIALSALEPGVGAASPEAVVADLAWRLPRRGGRLRDDLARWSFAEAAALGITGGGALTGYARHLLTPAQPDADGRPADNRTGEAVVPTGGEVAAALRLGLPEPVDTVLLQADLTAVAPGMLRRDVAAELGMLAEVESAGAGTVYRFTPASVRRGMDAGRTAAGVHAFLAAHSSTGVPQPLAYLVDDVARRHGSTRVGAATAYVRCADEPAMATLMADRRVSGLHLRLLAPTVAVTDSPPDSVLERLRTAGYAPAAEGADGAVVVGSGELSRAPVPVRRPVTVLGDRVPDERMLTAAASALVAGDRAVRARPRGMVPPDGARGPQSAALDAVAVLKKAMESGPPPPPPPTSRVTDEDDEEAEISARPRRPGPVARTPFGRRPEQRRAVWIGYTDSTGTVGERIVEPVRIDGGVLTAVDRRDSRIRTFALHRITAAALLDDAEPVTAP